MIWLLLVAVVGLACWSVNLRRRLQLVELGPTKEQVEEIVRVQGQHSSDLCILGFQVEQLGCRLRKIEDWQKAIVRIDGLSERVRKAAKQVSRKKR